MKPATRARSGQARNLDGRFTRGGSKEVVAAPVQARQQVAAVAQVGASGSKIGAAVANLDPLVPGRVLRNQEAPLPLPVAAVELAQQVADEDEEVSGSETEECVRDSSSGVSDSDHEEGGEQEVHEGLDSSPVDVVGGKLADQLFDDMPQSGPGAAGRCLGVAPAVGTSTRACSGAALVFDAAEPLGKAMLVDKGSVLPRSSPAAPRRKLGGDVPVKAHAGADGAVPKSPWVNLFKDNRNPGKGIMLEDREVDGDIVMLDEEDVDVVEEAWGFCLVGLFAGKFPGMAAVHKLCEGWKVKCSQWRHRSGWIIFKFQSDEDRLKVLNGGPYFVYGSNLMLKILPSCFRFEGEDVSSVPIWIQLPGLPLDCWNARALSKIVSKVGKPITTDKMTLTKERLSFARVLVEVDVTSDIVSEVEIGLPTGVVYHQPVIHEFTPKFCTKCKTFGHVEGTCGKGLEERQHKAYVAKKKSLSDTPVVEVQELQNENMEHGPVAAGSVHLVDDHAPERIQAWLLSGPKEVREAAAVPKKDRVDAVFSALPLALGVAGVFTRAALKGAGNSDGGRAGGCLPALLGAGLQPVIVADPASSCPVSSLIAGIEVGADSLVSHGVDDSSAGNKGKNKEGSGLIGAAVQHHSDGGDLWPDDGLDVSSVGWNVVGKKGKKGKRK